jgi:hypothetical protein
MSGRGAGSKAAAARDSFRAAAIGFHFTRSIGGTVSGSEAALRSAGMPRCGEVGSERKISGLGPGGGGGALLSVGSSPLPLPADPLDEDEVVGEVSTRWLGPGVGAVRAPIA